MTKFKMTWALLSQETAGKSGGASWGLVDQAVLQGHPILHILHKLGQACGHGHQDGVQFLGFI